MIGQHLKFLEELEQYLRDLGEYGRAAKLNEASWFLWETWDELLRLAVTEKEPKV